MNCIFFRVLKRLAITKISIKINADNLIYENKKSLALSSLLKIRSLAY